MSKLEDLYSGLSKDKKANVLGVDKTPIDAQKEPFKDSPDLVKNEKALTSARQGELGSMPSVPAGYKAPGYSPGDKEYSKLVKR